MIKKIGFDSIEELKKEKDLLSKLESLAKSSAKKDDISEDGVEEDRAEDIEGEVKAKGMPKSLEGTEDKEGEEEVVATDADMSEEMEDEEEDDMKMEDSAKDIEDEGVIMGEPESLEGEEDEVITKDQEITKEVPAEADEVEDEDGVDVASEEEETPKATRRIMAFEDFIKEKEETINKNIKYHDDDEEPEDYAVPVAASADPLAEAKVNEDDDDDDDEERGMEDEKKGDEMEDKGDKKVDHEDDKEKADHYKGAVKSDDKEIDALKKDVEYDKEEEEDAEKNESTIMSFETFVNEAYDRVVFGGNKGDKSKTHDGEDFEDEDEDDSANEKYDDVVLGGNKGDKSKTHDGEDYEDEDEKDESANEKYDDVVLGGNKGDKSKTHDGEDYEDEDEKDESVEEAVGEIITKIEGDELAGEEAGADGIAIPVEKGDGPETAAGIAGDMMDMGKPKSVEGKGKELITPDQKITDVVKGEADDKAEGTEIVKEEEEVLPDDSIAEKFRKLAQNKFGAVNEKEIKSADEFKEYAMAILKDAHGDDFDEGKAMEVVDGLTDKYGEDYGAMVGALQSSMGS